MPVSPAKGDHMTCNIPHNVCHKMTNILSYISILALIQTNITKIMGLQSSMHMDVCLYYRLFAFPGLHPSQRLKQTFKHANKSY